MRELAIGFAILTLLAALLAGCASEPETRRPVPDVVYSGWWQVHTFCDRGNRIYMSGHGLAAVPADSSCREAR